MKYSITALLLLSVIFSKGQTTTKTLENTGAMDSAATAKLLQSMQSYKIRWGFPGEDLPEVDTISVVFLLSDTTAFAKGTTFTYEGSVNAMGFSWVQRGYIARKRFSNQSKDFFWMFPVANLDEKKKPLPPTLIVWQTK